MIDEKELKLLLQQGETVSKISELYSCGEMTVYRAINKYGLKKEKPIYQNKEWLQKEISCKTIDQVASEQKVDSKTICRWIKKFNIKKNSPLYQNKEWLEKQRKKFNTIKELADAYDFSEYTVSDWCRKYNIKFNNSKDSFFDEKYFNAINSERKSYYLGFLMADGFMNSNLNNFGIGLCEKDEYMIVNLLNDMKYETSISKRISGFGKNSSYATICSTSMCKDLIYHGIVPKKSGKEIFPQYSIPEELKIHFIRGFIDGDGWITNNISKDNKTGKEYFKLEIGMCSMSLNILCDIKDYLKNKHDINSNITREKNKLKLYNLKIFGRVGKEFLDILYKDATIYLDRKKIKYDNVQLGPVNKNA